MTGDPKPVGAPKWMKVTLVISLALNLLIVGAIAGAALKGGGTFRADKGFMRGAEAAAIARALSEEDRRAVRQAMVQAFRAQGERDVARRADIEAFVVLMRDANATPDDISGQLAQVQARMMERLTLARQTLGAHLSSMDAAERAAYAARLEDILSDKER